MTLTPLPKQTIFERRRRARRDRVLLLAALLGGQLFFCGLMGLALHFGLYGLDRHWQWRRAAPWMAWGVGLGLLLSLVQLLWARVDKTWDLARRADARPPDPDDQRHQAFARVVQGVALAAGLGGTRVLISPARGFNSFAWMDDQGRPHLGITEGLLGRLDPDEQAAIGAHHATHLAYGDVEFFAFAGSTVGFFDALRSGLRHLELRGRGPGGAALLALLLLGVTNLARFSLRILFGIFARSRKRHADAGAVAMTRDPLALAQALHKASRGAGEGFQFTESLTPLLLVAPSGPDLNCHGPVEERIGLLVRDAGQSLKHLELRLRLRAAQAPPPRRRARPRWWLRGESGWLGPFGLIQLRSQPGYSGQAWVCAEGSQQVRRAASEPALLRGPGPGHCPRCGTGLSPRRVEGLRLSHCPHCDGHVAPSGLLQRLIARHEDRFGLATHKEALRLRRAEAGLRWDSAAGVCGFPPVLCPACGGPTKKQFFSHLAKVPVDRCQQAACGALWLDGGELELIQLLSERPGLGLNPDTGGLLKPRGRAKAKP